MVARINKYLQKRMLACLPFQRIIPLITAILLLASASTSQETAQWRGPERSGLFPDTGLLKTWPLGGPSLIWTVNGIGKGFSSAVTAGSTTFVTGSLNDSDYLTAISDSGKILWQSSYGYGWTGAHGGAKCTPVSDGKNVYVLSAYGNIACIDAGTGRTVWSFDARKKFEANPCSHGICESLLLFNGLLFYTPCGAVTTMVALDKDNGNTIWTTESLHDKSSYASPILIRHTNKDIVIALTDKYLIGVDAATGKILFRENYSEVSGKGNEVFYASSNAVTPLFHDGSLFITGGYNFGSIMFRINEDATGIKVQWTDSALDCQMGGVVLVNGYIYGSNWINNGKGNWCCLDWNSGKLIYEQPWFTKGAIISADSMLYCYEEKGGTIGLVEADPQQFNLTGSFRVTGGNGPHWAHPTISGGNLYVRHGDALMVYHLKRNVACAQNFLMD